MSARSVRLKSWSPAGAGGASQAVPRWKRFYCFLSVSDSERLSLQRLLKINVVQSRLLVEKNWVCSMGMLWSIEATEATASVIFCRSCVGKFTKNRCREKFWDTECDFAVWLSFWLSQVSWSVEQEAQLLPSDRAMRLVSNNLANYHATVQKLLIRQVLTKPMVWSWRFSWRQCVINKPTTVELCISPAYRRLAVAKFCKSTI